MNKFMYRNYVVTLETFDGTDYLYSIKDVKNRVYTLDDVKSVINELASDDIADIYVEIEDVKDELTNSDFTYYDNLVSKLRDSNIYVID